ncbi:60S ribosome subunit biogenesis protein NIP7 [Penicillium capsulatum]|uniref:60S ribosome subunit biogenesis protein NIP7 n=1 Tax=Penicillium capsulatum TaxID=69766 RepID=A0A9W9M043_9EURO|nr:60S ribosome subunit biogenesis protein NIP7 [Penicillium capsulatum]KAJ6129068.1 60S ribosome subunit biogenesis protein NIP7 [Penicillium capsulatum]
MRSLTEEETRVLFSKLANYTGKSLNNLIAPPSADSAEDDRHVFRLIGSRVYYMPLKLANLAVSIPRDNLLTVGTQIGKFTKTGKFRLNITALNVVSEHSRYKVWIKANGEMPLLYGGNVLRAHIARFSDNDIPEHSGVLIYSQNDEPLGFGICARSAQEIRKLEPTGIAVFRQADAGEWLREEDTLFTT